MCDVVINHRTADEIGPEGVHNVYSDEVDHTGIARALGPAHDHLQRPGVPRERPRGLGR